MLLLAERQAGSNGGMCDRYDAGRMKRQPFDPLAAVSLSLIFEMAILGPRQLPESGHAAQLVGRVCVTTDC
jgi:hypothetical protein